MQRGEVQSYPTFDANGFSPRIASTVVDIPHPHFGAPRPSGLGSVGISSNVGLIIFDVFKKA